MQRALGRRALLKNTACGFGYLALAGLTAGKARAESVSVNPLAPRPPHFNPRAKRVIFLFMQGGVSQVDSYDYKPRLLEADGKMLSFDDARSIADTGTRESLKRVMKPLWKFAQHGQCGRWGSALFPEINRHVDDLCFIHSMHTEGVSHGPATLFLHCGSTNTIRPSVGSWVLYGLGTENENLPGFVTIAPSAGTPFFPLPALALPVGQPLGDPLGHLLAVGHHLNPARAFETRHPFDDARQFHAVVGGVRQGARRLDGLAARGMNEDERPTARPGIAAASPIREEPHQFFWCAGIMPH